MSRGHQILRETWFLMRDKAIGTIWAVPVLILMGWLLGVWEGAGVQPAWIVALLVSIAAALWLNRKIRRWEARIPHRSTVFAAPDDDRDAFFVQRGYHAASSNMRVGGNCGATPNWPSGRD